MSKLKCVRDTKTKKVYCVDPFTGEIKVYAPPVSVKIENVPPCIITSLLRKNPDGVTFELDIKETN